MEGNEERGSAFVHIFRLKTLKSIIFFWAYSIGIVSVI